MPVFVNYAGPKLDKKQKQIVRSQAMVSVRGQQKQAKGRRKSGAFTRPEHSPDGETCIVASNKLLISYGRCHSPELKSPPVSGA